jgi:hypothetical protein
MPSFTGLDPRAPISIMVHDAPTPSVSTELQQRIDQAWADQRAANPSLFDGPILSVSSIDARSGTITCVCERFARLMVQSDPAVGDLGVRLLGIKAIVRGRDTHQREHVLLARRGREVRVYPGLWEIGPAGGVDIAGSGTFTHDALTRTLIDEAHEELALELTPEQIAPPALIVHDELALCHDLIAPVTWSKPINPRWTLCASAACANSEYLDACWVPIDELPGFMRDHAHAISPVTHVALRELVLDRVT